MTRGAELKLSMAYDYLPLVVNWGASACMFMLLTHCCRVSQEFILTTGFTSKQSSEHGYLSDVGPAFIHARTLERGKLLTKTIEASRDQNNRINIHEARIEIAVKIAVRRRWQGCIRGLKLASVQRDMEFICRS